MFQLPLSKRTVGVVTRKDAKMAAGYTLFNASRETYLIDEDGQLVHQWRSCRNVFTSYLLPSGNLLRDGTVALHSPGFQVGGAGGVVEEVDWDNRQVWVFDFYPYQQTLAHHDLEPLANGHVLVMVWERKTKQQALDAGRRPDLIADEGIWNDLIIELKPEGSSATRVWQWSMWDHLIQDFCPSLPHFGDVSAHPELFDINICPVAGKGAQRNKTLAQEGMDKNCLGLAFWKQPGKTGEKDWLHINSISHDPVRDQIALGLHNAGEVVIIDHSTTTQEASSHEGGQRGKGGDILYRFGNPAMCRQGTLADQFLFCSHHAVFIRGAPGEGNVLIFNNGRAPDRLFSTVEEYELADSHGNFSPHTGPQAPVWSYGEPCGKYGSFYCTHISGARRLVNGNTLVIMGPQGILFEITPEGEEVWRYINPVQADCEHYVAAVRQGDFRAEGKFSLFTAMRYERSYPGLLQDGKPRQLQSGRYLEA